MKKYVHLITCNRCQKKCKGQIVHIFRNRCNNFEDNGRNFDRNEYFVWAFVWALYDTRAFKFSCCSVLQLTLDALLNQMIFFFFLHFCDWIWITLLWDFVVNQSGLSISCNILCTPSLYLISHLCISFLCSIF